MTNCPHCSLPVPLDAPAIDLKTTLRSIAGRYHPDCFLKWTGPCSNPEAFMAEFGLVNSGQGWEVLQP